MFNLNTENKNVVDHLLQKAFKDNLYDLIFQKTNIRSFNIKVKDLAQMIKSKVDIYKDTPYKATDYLDGNTIFDKLTNQVLKMEVKSNCNLKYLYDNYLSKLFTLSNIYGIVGKEKDTGEIINFSNPFRLMTLIKDSSKTYNIDNLFVYKKNNVFTDELTEKERLTLKTYFSLYINLFSKGLVQDVDTEIECNRYISLNKSKLQEGFRSIKTYVYTEANKNKVSKYSYMYFSDILVYNTFCPYYALYNLKVNRGQLYGSYFKHIPMYSPNIARDHRVCTGSLRQLSNEGIECLKIANLASPFFHDIFEKKECSYYVDLNIEFAKNILKKEFRKVEK